MIAMALAICGCGASTAKQSNQASLAGTQWVVQTLAGQPPMAGTTLTAEFSERDISGSAGCNHYSGSYQASDSHLTIGTVAMTEMYCTEPAGLMEQEQAFLSALTAVASYRLTADRLEMLDSTAKVVLTFTSPAPMPEVTLEDTDWALTTLIEGETATSLVNGTAIRLRFEKGTVSGSAGCNDYHGAYTLQRGTLKIAEIGMTKKNCVEPAGTMEQEAHYIDILQNATIFELDANQLTLRTADGRGLVFTAAQHENQAN